MLVNVPTGTLVAALTQAATVLPVATYCDDIAPGNQAVVDVTYGNVTEQITIGQCVNGYPSIIARGTQPRAFPAGSCVTNVIPEEETECPNPIELTWAMEDGAVTTKYSKCYELPLGEYTLGDTLIPDGFEIDITGKSLCLWSTALPERLALHPVRAEIWKDDCLFAIVSGALNIVDACYVTPPCPVIPGCTYSWAMTPTTVAVGSPIKTSFIAPEGCPENVTLSLDVFEANGTTPYLVGGQPLVISVDQGTSEYRPIAAEAGTVTVFKPSATQQLCLSTCQASIPSQKRVVLELPPCSVTFDIQPRTFQAGAQSSTQYSAYGPEGCAVKILLFDGNAPVMDGGSQLSYVIQVGSPISQITPWPLIAVGRDYNWRPAPTIEQAICAQNCTIQPSRIDFDVVTSSCVIQWDVFPSPTSVGQLSAIRVTSGPPNCLIAFDAYDDRTGVIIAGSTTNIQTNSSGAGSTTPYPCDSAGVALWKPSVVQPNICAQSCSFGRASFRHVCAGETGSSTCGISLTAICQSPLTNTIQYTATGLINAQDYTFQYFYAPNSTWNLFEAFTASGTTKTSVTSADPVNFTKFRVIKTTDNSCVSNETINPCGISAPLNYYCSSGTCVQASSAPAGATGPFNSSAQCLASCGGVGPNPGCPSRLITPADVGSPSPPCGTNITIWDGLAGAAWNHSFAINDGTVSASGMPSGMTGVTVGSSFNLSWAVPVAGSYTIIVTATKPGCPNCTYTVNLTIATAAPACASLTMSVLKGDSAYTPVNSLTFNAADQVLRMKVTGPVGGTFKVDSTGTVVSTTGVQTIGLDGTATVDVVIGQWNTYSTTFTLSAAGGAPITVCAGAGTATITGSTCVTLAVTQNATDYTVLVTSPPGALGVPITLQFGGAAFGGSPLCASSSFGVTNFAITTNSNKGGNSLVIPIGPITAPYSAAINLLLNAETSQLTHQLCGITCHEVNYP